MPGPPHYRSIYLRVAAGIVAMVALLVGWQIVWVQRNELTEVERAEVERIAHDMSLLQASLDFAFAAGAVEQADRELTARGADPDVIALLLVDASDRVVASRLRHELGLPVTEALGEAPPADMLATARERQVGSARLSPDRRRVVAAYPVVLGVEPGRIRADRIGVVVLVHSLDGTRAEVHARIWSRALELVVGAAVGVAALLGSGQVLIGRRVRKLVAATERFSGGDLDTRAHIQGSDELALIGASFDAMAARVGDTQRRVAESEARYRALVEEAPVGILRTDAAGQVVECNAAWRNLAVGDGDAWPAAIHPDDRERVLKEWREAGAAGRTARAECRLLGPDGSVVWIQALGVPDEAARPYGFINTAVDLTERRRGEQMRAQLEARLQQAQKAEALGTLASGVAHDFNNVLAAVLGRAELLAKVVAGQPEAEHHAQDLLRAVERGRGLVRQILTFGRPGPRSLRQVSLEPLLDEAARFLRPSLPANVTLRVNVAPDVPPIVADPDQLHRLLVNLGTNAWHAMRPGGGVLDMEARAVQADDDLRGQAPGWQPGPTVVLRVRDEGCGMDAATKAHIFEPFFTTKPPGEGTGLGLAVVHGIVRAHNGAIVVDSEPGKGTTVSVYLPVAGPAPEPPTAAPREVPRTTATSPHVLYVDDDEDLRHLAEIAFGRAGFRVTAHGRPDVALAAFREAPETFDLVVTDQRMPGMLGEELLVALLKARPELPVLLMSGFVTSELADRIRALGARAVVEKPMSVDDLVEVCRRVLADARPA